jgi:penicillin amidase
LASSVSFTNPKTTFKLNLFLNLKINPFENPAVMKLLKRFFLALIIAIFIIAVAVFIWFKSTAPDYSGTVNIAGLHHPVKVTFDEYGVPHIQAKDAHDAYMALGYVQAQDRLFQMEMTRRVAGGTLSEILGKDLVNIDKKLRNLALYRMAENAVKRNFSGKQQPYNSETLAYLEGVNSFIDNGTLPIEFTLIGFKPEHFGVKDVYAIIGYMAFTFTSAITQDPAVTDIKQKLGEQYLKLFDLDSVSAAEKYSIPDLSSEIFPDLKEFQEYIPIPIWEGSNNWVVNKDRSRSGKPILANDTHIKYSQPSVWYETVLEYPGNRVAGYYLAGVPYAVVGNTDHYAWGVTIFPFDNMDLYKEKSNPDDSDQVWENDHWQTMQTDRQIIKVKDGDDVIYDMKYTRHGPVMNEAYPDIAQPDGEPVTLWWSMRHLDATALQALYYINNAHDMQEFRKGCSLIDVLGLNVVYADTRDNIAWWASGRIPKRPPYVNSSLVLDGASGKDEVLGFYPFELNPQSENPPDGLIETSNNQPPAVNGIIYPGYYYPGYRTKRAIKLLNAQDKWTPEEMKKIQLDNVSDRDKMLAALVLQEIGAEKSAKTNAVFDRAVKALEQWKGSSNVDDVGVTIFTKMLYYIAEAAMADELGQQSFDKFVNTILVRSSFEKLFTNPDCIWWDNISTPEKETRLQAFRMGFDKAVISLQQQFGDDVSTWKWGKVHTVTHIHPIGRQEPFDKIFNVGPYPIGGTNEVLDKESIHYNAAGVYPVETGPALRFIIDMANPTQRLTVIPTGQSGNFMSPHYADQAKMFVEGKYRTLQSDASKIKDGSVLMLEP